MIKVLPPKTAKEVVARERERKARTTLLMALPEDHLEKFHKMDNAKEIAPPLDYDDLKQINDDDMEEMDLKWQLETAKQKGTRTAEEEMMGIMATKLETMSGHVEDDAQNYAMMAYSSSNSGSDNKFQIQKVWILVDLPFGKKAIETKWVYHNKNDERGVVVRKKARLVAQGYRQEERIDYDEYDTIDEEVYVSQPPNFVDPKFPNKVYKVVKASYGLHQAPRAWYATCSTFLKKSGYRRGAIDKTLFIKHDKKDIMRV
nr:hypothetical protein [Tanacetum cinerariifolium]